MEVPENFRALGTVGTAYKGEYDHEAEYKYANTVYYEGSTYIALKDNPDGGPRNDKINWMYFSKGVDIEIATTEKAGIVKPDGKTITIKEDGTITGASAGFTGTMEQYEISNKAGEIVEGQIVNITDDNEEYDTGFESGDEENPIEYTDVPVIADNEPVKSFREKVSAMVKNVRYLIKMMGNTDISKIGNGTVTGAIDTLNGNFGKLTSWTPSLISGASDITLSGGDGRAYYKIGKLVFISCDLRFSLTNPTGDPFVLKAPFPAASARNYGGVGYNTFGKATPYIVVIGNELSFCYSNTGQGENLIKGTDLGSEGHIIQFSACYIAN